MSVWWKTTNYNKGIYAPPIRIEIVSQMGQRIFVLYKKTVMPKKKYIVPRNLKNCLPNLPLETGRAKKKIRFLIGTILYFPELFAVRPNIHGTGTRYRTSLKTRAQPMSYLCIQRARFPSRLVCDVVAFYTSVIWSEFCATVIWGEALRCPKLVSSIDSILRLYPLDMTNFGALNRVDNFTSDVQRLLGRSI